MRVESPLFAKDDPHDGVSQDVRRYRTHNASLGERTPLSSGLRPLTSTFMLNLATNPAELQDTKPQAFLFKLLFRALIKKGRGGQHAASLAKCWAKNAKVHRDSQLEKHDELEGLQGPIRPFDVDENKKKIVPLDRKFLRSYAKNIATDAPPSDLLQVREGIATAKDMRLPSYFAVPICISKLGPSIRSAGGKPHPARLRQGKMP